MKNFNQISLNEEQNQAVLNINGPTRIIAGPGTGKTRTLISKISYILENNYANSYEILAITFTNKAVGEIKNRLSKTIDNNTLPDVFTYHAWAARFLRIEYEKLNLNKDYRILDSQDSISILKNILKQEEFDVNVNEAFNHFPIYNSFPEKLSEDLKTKISFKNQIAKLYEKYILKKNEINALDFDDLLIKVYEILSKNPQTANFYKEKYKYIFIDEFQDTNDIQYKIIKLITNKNSNLTVVGDPDQNIYSWRGANISIILNFVKDYDNVKTFILKENYRSTKNILEAANLLISNNKNRVIVDLFTNKKENYDLNFFEAFSPQIEAEYVFKQIVYETNFNKTKLHDIAIIYRNNFISREFESIFTSNKIPYKLIGGFRFFERKEVKETLNFLHFLIKKDNFSFSNIINVPAKGIGEVTLNKIYQKAIEMNISYWDVLEKNMIIIPSLKEFIEKINFFDKKINSIEELKKNFIEFLNEINYISFYQEDTNKIKNIEGTIEQVCNYLKSNTGEIEDKIVSFFHSVALSSSGDLEQENNHLTLITAHAAKGTEFKIVFFVGLNQGVIPSYRSFSNKDQLEEERRIAYVAITRAKDKLFLTYPLGYDFSNKERIKSQFINEINSQSNNYNKGVKNTKMQTFINQTNITNGDIIVHSLFGDGVVIEDGGDLITVAFEKKVGLKQLLKAHPSVRKK